MFKKFSVFCILFLAFSIVFRGFSALETNSGSGSGSMLKPSVGFKKWRVGRIDKDMTDTGNTEHLSFITSTQTLCHFSASVKYGEITNKQNTSPIDPKTVGWSVVEASHKMKLKEGSLQHNWSGPNPAELDSGTLFNVVGSLEVLQVVGTRTVRYKKNGQWHTKQVPDYLKATSCTASDANRANRTPVHRDGTNMKFKLKFTAQTKAGQTVSAVLALEADEKDQIRQEYVDYSRPLPSRDDSKWTGENTYDFGHYSQMMDVGLADKQADWVKEINKIIAEINRRENKNIAAVKVSDFILNSGYRHPHHNFDHAGSTSLLSSHMYGYALDVNGEENSKKKVLDLNGDKVNNSKDRKIMTDAADNAGSRYEAVYSSSLHVHADWAPSGWGSGSISSAPTFSLPPAGTELVDCDKRRENNCNIQVSSSSEHYVTCGDSDCGESYWSCHSGDYNEHRLRTCTWEKLPNGKNCGESWRLCQYPPEKIGMTQYSIASPKCVTDPNGNRNCAERPSNTAPSGGETTPGSNAPLEMMYACGVHSGDASLASSHALQASCSETDSYGQGCTVTNFYACQTHTHQYPALISGVCGHTYTSANAYNHRSETCPTNSNGQSCTSGSYYACQSHTHVYPPLTVSCGRAACTQTVSSTDEHRETCASGHLYWSCKPSDVHLHKTRTCIRSGCGQSWLLCTSSKPNCLVNAAWKCRAE